MTYDSLRLDLFLAHRSALIDYAQPIVGCRARAEDVVQEAYLRFAAATDRQRAADDRILQPVGYLYRIVRNLAVDWARHLAQEDRPPSAVIEQVASAAPSPEQAALDRDEAHRFAITHHKKLRSKQTLSSALDRIPGIGATRRRALLRAFGSVKGVEQASLDELMQVPGMNPKLAQQLWQLFHPAPPLQ